MGKDHMDTEHYKWGSTGWSSGNWILLQIKRKWWYQLTGHMLWGDSMPTIMNGWRDDKRREDRESSLFEWWRTAVTATQQQLWNATGKSTTLN